jgi:hypothetical protein
MDSVLLAFRELKGSHIGENITLVIGQVASEYNISESNIGIFILDDVSNNNNTYINILGKGFGWSKEECKQRRLRYFGYIVNLITQAFIFGAESKIFE